MAKDPTLKQVHEVVTKVLAQQSDMFDDVRLLRKVQDEHTERLDELQETLDSVARAVDKDAVTLIAHGRRLARIERGHS